MYERKCPSVRRPNSNFLCAFLRLGFYMARSAYQAYLTPHRFLFQFYCFWIFSGPLAYGVKFLEFFRFSYPVNLYRRPSHLIFLRTSPTFLIEGC